MSGVDRGNDVSEWDLRGWTADDRRLLSMVLEGRGVPHLLDGERLEAGAADKASVDEVVAIMDENAQAALEAEEQSESEAMRALDTMSRLAPSLKGSEAYGWMRARAEKKAEKKAEKRARRTERRRRGNETPRGD